MRRSSVKQDKQNVGANHRSRRADPGLPVGDETPSPRAAGEAGATRWSLLTSSPTANSLRGGGFARPELDLCAPLQPIEDPSPGVSPPPMDRFFGNTQRGPHLRHRQSGKESEADDLGRRRVDLFEFTQRFVQGQEALVRRGCRDAHLIEIQASLPASMSQPGPSASLLNENPTHGFGRRREEVGAIFPTRLPVATQPQPSLVDERGGLERLARGPRMPSSPRPDGAVRHRPAGTIRPPPWRLPAAPPSGAG